MIYLLVLFILTKVNFRKMLQTASIISMEKRVIFEVTNDMCTLCDCFQYLQIKSLYSPRLWKYLCLKSEELLQQQEMLTCILIFWVIQKEIHDKTFAALNDFSFQYWKIYQFPFNFKGCFFEVKPIQRNFAIQYIRDFVFTNLIVSLVLQF